MSRDAGGFAGLPGQTYGRLCGHLSRVHDLVDGTLAIPSSHTAVRLALPALEQRPPAAPDA